MCDNVWGGCGFGVDSVFGLGVLWIPVRLSVLI